MHVKQYISYMFINVHVSVCCVNVHTDIGRKIVRCSSGWVTSMCVCDTGAVITEGSEVKIVPFPISSYPSIDLFCQQTTPILCLLRIHTSYAECWLYLHATRAVKCLQYLNKQSGVSHMWDVHAHVLYTHRSTHKHIALPCDHTPPVHLTRYANFSPPQGGL